MSLPRSLVALAASLALGSLSLAGCAGEVAPSPTPSSTDVTASTQSAAQTFTLTEQDDYHLAGTFAQGAWLISFRSEMSTDGISTVELTVNGATLHVTADLFAHEAQEDGGGNTLMADDVHALKAFEKYLDAHGQKARPWERLFKTVSMYAAAPAGWTILQKTIGVAKGLRDGSGRPSGSVSDEGIIYMCVGATGHHMYDQADWAWAEHDSQAGESGSGLHGRLEGWEPGGCFLNSLSSYAGGGPPQLSNQAYNPNYDGAQVGSSSVSQGYTNGAWTDGAYYNDSDGVGSNGTWTGGGSCEGRCGAGCPYTYNYYWTKDCFDHDICLDYHTSAASTSSSGDCGWEYSDAQDDWAWGSSDSYQNSYCGSVPTDWWGASTCTENGNAQTAGW